MCGDKTRDAGVLFMKSQTQCHYRALITLSVVCILKLHVLEDNVRVPKNIQIIWQDWVETYYVTSETYQSAHNTMSNFRVLFA